jgi:HlyD family secretion protein
VKLSARNVAVLVGITLVALAAGAGLAYWRLQPEPQPSQVIYGSGRIEADEVRVGMESAGRLVEIRAVEGATVTAGEVLARIEATDYELQTERAEAQRSAALRTRAQVESQISLAAHHAATARTNLSRYEQLGSQGYIPAQRLDSARDAYEEAAHRVSVLKEQRAEAAAQAQAAAKSLALAASQRGKTVVRAPITGAVLERLAEPGEVVGPGQAVAILADLSTVRLKVFISEVDLGKVRLGAPARLRVDAFPGRDFDARVARVDAQAQFTPRDVHMADERSRTVYGIILEAPNPEGLLKPGMPADAWILWDEANGWPAALQVPE